MRINPLFILPNLFTAFSGFLGMLSIIYSNKGYIESACWLIIIAMVLDGLDGRVARMTNTESKFGVEFDSLCDLVAFGCAPALMMYFSIGSNYGRLGAMISCLFVVFGAIRLAKFNVIFSLTPSKYFIGLPIPSAAIFVVTLLTLQNRYKIISNEIIVLVLCFIVAILMVSNIRYPNFKKLSWNLRKLILVIIIFGFVFIYPIEGIFTLISVYILFGILRFSYILFSKLVINRIRKFSS